MSNQVSSSPASAAMRGPAPVFQWVLTACAILMPILLVAYAFTTSVDAMERARIIVQGLESTVLTLVAVLILGGLYLFGEKSGRMHQMMETSTGSSTVSV